MRSCIPLLPLINRDRKATELRFWSRVDKGSPDECWPWLRGCCSAGYGIISVAAKVCISSRLAYALSTNEEPGGLRVCHTCDNPPCCNPAHLFLGTDKDNMADMAAKGRRSYASIRGRANIRARLTEAQVLYIRSSPKPARLVGAELGVPSSTVSHVRRGRSWAWLSDEAVA
jgi:hypothetical protein